MMDHLGLKLTKQMLTNKFIASIKYTFYLNEWHWILMNVTVNIIISSQKLSSLSNHLLFGYYLVS